MSFRVQEKKVEKNTCFAVSVFRCFGVSLFSNVPILYYQRLLRTPYLFASMSFFQLVELFRRFADAARVFKDLSKVK